MPGGEVSVAPETVDLISEGIDDKRVHACPFHTSQGFRIVASSSEESYHDVVYT